MLGAGLSGPFQFLFVCPRALAPFPFQFTDEFVGYRRKITEKNRQPLLKKALGKLERGLFREEWAENAQSVTDEDARPWFHQCSTGHKITLLVVFGLVANLETNSLVLIDEPETHLHPPLLSAMMHALRQILEEYEASREPSSSALLQCAGG